MLLALSLPACSHGCGAGGVASSSDAASGTSSSSGAAASSGEAALQPPKAPVWPVDPALRHKSGVAATLLRAAHELTLEDPRKASVGQIERGLLTEPGDGGTGPMGPFFTDLANGIHAGKLDKAKLAADYAAIDKDTAAMRAKEIAAIGALHDLLSAAERQSITTALRTRRAAHERRRAARAADAGGLDWAKVRLERLTRDLSLDVDGGQQDKVASVVNAAAKTDPQNPEVAAGLREESRTRFDAILTAFEADALDAGALPLSATSGKSFHEGAERIASFYEQLVPMLKPDQRDKLGQQLVRFAARPSGHFMEDAPLTEGVEEGPGGQGGP